MGVVIADNHLTYNGNKYFTANAQTVTIGSYGSKATPLFGQNKLEVTGHFPAPGIDGKIQKSGPVTLDTATSSKGDFTSMFSGVFHAIGFSGSSSVIYDNLYDRHLKLVELWIDEVAAKSWVNGSPMHRTNFANEGSDGRLAHRIFVVMEAAFATSFTSGTNFDVTADAAGIISVNATGGGVVSGKSKVTLSPGTVYAYLLYNPDWNADKTKVDDFTVDEWSIN